MNKIKSIPEGVSAVIPMLICKDVSSEIEFCKIVLTQKCSEQAGA